MLLSSADIWALAFSAASRRELLSWPWAPLTFCSPASIPLMSFCTVLALAVVRVMLFRLSTLVPISFLPSHTVFSAFACADSPHPVANASGSSRPRRAKRQRTPPRYAGGG